jgi:hypothetical protein
MILASCLRHAVNSTRMAGPPVTPSSKPTKHAKRQGALLGRMLISVLCIRMKRKMDLVAHLKRVLDQLATHLRQDPSPL